MYARATSKGTRLGSDQYQQRKFTICLPTIANSLTLNLNDISSSFFVAKFIKAPNQRIIRGFFEFVAVLHSSELHAVPCFKRIVDACSLESFQNSHLLQEWKSLQERARSLYTQALAETAAALQDPKTAMQDATLASILLLGLFEDVASTRPTLPYWNSHIPGAIQLVKARGPTQLRTKTGLELYFAVRTFAVSL